MLNVIKRKLNTLYRTLYNKPIGVIYMMHRVCTFEKGKLKMNEHLKVTPEFLEQFIVDRINNYEFISLDELEDVILKKKKINKPFIVFTLDDGYRDNFENAFPIFKKYNIPFAIYITSGFIDRTVSLWWYVLEQIIVDNSIVKLSNGITFKCESAEEKESSFLEIRKLILELPTFNFNFHLSELLSNYSIENEVYTENLMLNWTQIVELSKNSLCTIAAHSVTHRRLSELNQEDVQKELLHSKEVLEMKIGKVVNHFAYPFGTNFEVNTDVVNNVLKLGFRTAPLSNGGEIRKLDKDLFRLSRTMLVEKL